MSRATLWQPLCESDPTPGEPDEVARAGKHYTSMAEEIRDQVDRLRGLVSGTLQGCYAETLTEAAEGLSNDLAETSTRYRKVGGSLQQWAPELQEFQDEAEGLRRQAVTAQGDMADNAVIQQLSPVGAEPPPDAEVAAAKARQGRYDDAQGDLGRAQGRLLDLTDRRDSAAAKIADAIRDTCDDEVANNLWDDFKGWMDEHHELVSNICKVLGVVAMAACLVALVVPGLNVLAATALLAGAGSLLGHTALATTGNGSWGDVGMDVFALGTFGLGRFLGPGVKVFGKEFGGALGKLTANTKAAGAFERGTAARMPIRAQARMDVGQARSLLVRDAPRAVRRGVTREVGAIRAQARVDSQQAFETAESAYLTRVATKPSWTQSLRSGLDPDLAALRAQAQHAASGFAPTSRVGLAAAKAETQYWKAVVPTGVSNLSGGVSILQDQISSQKTAASVSMTREGSDL